MYYIYLVLLYVYIYIHRGVTHLYLPLIPAVHRPWVCKTCLWAPYAWRLPGLVSPWLINGWSVLHHQRTTVLSVYLCHIPMPTPQCIPTTIHSFIRPFL